MVHIILGLFFISLGIWGVFDEWYYVVDFVKGGSSIFLAGAGLVAILAGVIGPLKQSKAQEGEGESQENVLPFGNEE